MAAQISDLVSCSSFFPYVIINKTVSVDHI